MIALNEFLRITPLPVQCWTGDGPCAEAEIPRKSVAQLHPLYSETRLNNCGHYFIGKTTLYGKSIAVTRLLLSMKGSASRLGSCNYSTSWWIVAILGGAANR